MHMDYSAFLGRQYSRKRKGKVSAEKKQGQEVKWVENIASQKVLG